jgi:hypothetical protein
MSTPAPLPTPSNAFSKEIDAYYASLDKKRLEQNQRAVDLFTELLKREGVTVDNTSMDQTALALSPKHMSRSFSWFVDETEPLSQRQTHILNALQFIVDSAGKNKIVYGLSAHSEDMSCDIRVWYERDPLGPLPLNILRINGDAGVSYRGAEGDIILLEGKASEELMTSVVLPLLFGSPAVVLVDTRTDWVHLLGQKKYKEMERFVTYVPYIFSNKDKGSEQSE